MTATGNVNTVGNYSLGATGPLGAGPLGASSTVGSMYYDNHGNLAVNSSAGWITVSPGTGASGAYTLNNSPYTYSPYSNDVVIKRPGKEEIKVGATLDAIMERLCIIEPAFEKLEKYPALKEAYNNYKMIEALIKNDEGNEDE